MSLFVLSLHEDAEPEEVQDDTTLLVINLYSHW